LYFRIGIANQSLANFVNDTADEINAGSCEQIGQLA